MFTFQNDADFPYGFENNFIGQKVYVVFAVDAYPALTDFLNTRTVDELRLIQNELENADQETREIVSDPYSRLTYDTDEVSVYVFFPNYPEEMIEWFAYEPFYKLIVRYNHAYDCILINNPPRTISPRAQKIIDEI